VPTEKPAPNDQKDTLTLPATQATEPDGGGVTRILPEPGRERYQVGDLIATGGMGEVRQAHDRVLDRTVAVKLVKPQLLGKPSLLERFQEEARIAGRLQHPGVPPIYDLGALPDGRPFLAMKLIQGQTFAALLRARSSPADNHVRSLQVFEAICQTVAYAHEQGVIHRDLKPANVMVGEFGEVQVMDWGLAKILASRGRQPPESGAGSSELPALRGLTPPARLETDQTHDGAVMGTPAYMPPEQARGEVAEVDRRADVFALGSILCEILTGESAYPGQAALALARAGRGDLADAHARLAACGVDPELVALALRCLAPQREARPESAAVVARAVADYRGGVEERLRRAERERAAAEARATEERKRRRVQWMLAGVAVLLLLTVGGAWWWYDRQQAATGAAIVEDQAVAEQALREQRLVTASERLDQSDRRIQATGLTGPAQRQASLTAHLSLARALDVASVRRWTATGRKFQSARARREFAEVFATHGLGIAEGSVDVAAVVQLLSPSPIRERVQMALEDWLMIADDPTIRLRLTEILNALDPDESHSAARSAWAAGDGATLIALASRTRPEKLTARLALLLTEHPDVPFADRLRLLREARNRWPDDVGVAFQAGAVLSGMEHGNEAQLLAEAAGAYRSVLAVQPGNGAAWNNLGHVLEALHDRTGAERAFRKVVELQPGEAHGYGNLGAVLAARGDLAGSEAALRRAIELDPDEGNDQYGLGNVLRLKKDAAGAEAAFRAATVCRSRPALGHEGLGTLLADRGDLAGAEVECREAVRLEPDSAALLLSLGEILRRKGDTVEAEATLRKAIQLEPASWRAHLALGNLLYEGKETAQAEASYRRALQIDPASAPTWVVLGQLRFSRKDWTGAESAARAAIEFEPTLAPGHFLLGNVLRVKGNLAGAEAAYRKASDLDPEDAGILVNLGVVLDGQKDFAGAEAAFRQATQVRPTFAPAFMNLGSFLRTQGNLAGAEKALREALRLDERFPLAHVNLGLLLEAKKDLTGAEAAYRKASDLDPNDPGAHHLLAVLLVRTQDYAAAEAACRQSLRLNPDNADAYLTLGNLLAQKKDRTGAEQAFRTATEVNPGLAAAHDRLGDMLRQRHDFSGAEAEFEQAARLLPEWADAHLHVGIARFQQGHLAEALAPLKRAGELAAPVSPVRQRAAATWSHARWLIYCDARLPRMLEGAEDPERLTDYFDFANLCLWHRQRYTESTDLFQRAFAAIPGSIDDLKPSHRLYAAHAAVRAANGEGINPPDEAGRLALRRQALAWLQADLAARKKAGDPFLEEWLTDPALASVRGSAIARLPEDRAAWHQLWDDVYQAVAPK
jgi:tetratricopeptide (TPR) repeat protein